MNFTADTVKVQQYSIVINSAIILLMPYNVFFLIYALGIISSFGQFSLD